MCRAFRVAAILVMLVCLLLASCSTNKDEPPEIAQRVIELVAGQNLAGLVAAASTQERPCTLAPESSLFCEQGDAEGTTYRVFPSAACQGFWTRDVQATMQGLLNTAGEPFSIARLGAPPEWAREPGPPYGEYMVIFAARSGPQAPQAVAVYVADDVIVRTQVGCRRADQFLEPGVGEKKPKVVWRPK